MKSWWYHETIRSARLALPPRWTLAAVAIVYVLSEALQQIGRAVDAGQFGQLGRGPLWYLGVLASLEPSVFQSLQAGVLCIAAAAFAVYRVAAFHPYFRETHRDWLMTTCWRVGKPLPLGPVTLTFADAFLLALATGLFWHAKTPVPLFAAIGLFAALYLIFVALSFLFEAPRGFGYAVVFGLLGMLMFARKPEIAFVIAVPTYVVACFGLRRSLARLPNYEPTWLEKNFTLFVTRRPQLAQSQPSMAWPFAYLSPQRPPDGLPRFDAVCIALLGGWTFISLTVAFNWHADSFLMPDSEAPKFISIGGILCGVAAVVRFFAYCAYYRPPISLLGRLATRRWLIPSYDRGLVAPLCSLLILWCIEPGALRVLDIPTAVEMSLTLTLALLVGLVPGPSYRSWALTSECRIVPVRPR